MEPIMSKHAILETGISIPRSTPRWPGTLMAILILLLTPGVRAQAPGTTQAASDYSKEAFVVEKLNVVTRFESDGTSTRTTTSVIRVQSEAGVQQWGVLSAGYNSASDEVKIGYVRVRKGDGSVVETAAETAQDVTSEISRVAPMYTDYHEKHLAVKGLGVGDALEYQFIIHTKTPLIPGQFGFEYDFEKSSIVLHEQVEVDIPKDREVRVKSPGSKPVIAEHGDRRVYTWESSNHDIEKNDEPRREFPSPNILMSTFKSWEDLGRWWTGLEQERVAPTPEIRAKAGELTRNAKTREEKIRALYDYVSTHFRYISISFGIGRYQPHAAAEVLKNAYGDCKDKHTLLASLLQAVGIEAYPALMNSKRHIDPDVPSPGQFDHVITAVPESPGSSKFTWLDTTSEVGPYGYLIFLLRGKQALVIPPAQPAALLSTPADPPFKNFRNYEIDAKLNDSGILEGRMRRSFRGDSEIVLRALFRQTPQSQWKDLVQGISQAAGFAGEVSDVQVGAPEATSEPFSFSNEYTRKDYPDWSNHRITPPLGFLGFPEIRDGAKRKRPILLGAPDESSWIARVELPKGYRPSILPPVDVVRDFAEYHSSYKFKDGVFTAEVRVIIKQSEVPLAKLKDYQSFQKAISEDQNQYTVLAQPQESSRGQTAAEGFKEYVPTPSSNQEANDLFDLARQDSSEKNLSGASEALQRAVRLDDHFKAAWIMLGAINMFEGRIREGAANFRKAIELDPGDPQAYEMLGSMYIRAQHSEDAISVWRELLKIDPSNTRAHENLGNALVGLKRYKEAIPDLEAALTAPNVSATLALNLAKAYVAAGTPEKAVGPLTRIGDEAVTSDSLNEVAYALADNNLDLPDAQKYAEKAVKSIEADAAQVRLDTLEQDDLRRMLQLANYWDTLGWVHYRKAEYGEAQKYIEAAWNLEQDRVNGEHLAQVYEKLGKSSAAVHQHALARELTDSGGFAPARTDSAGRFIAPRLTHRGTELEELSQMRRTPLGKLSTQTGSAEFFLLLATGGTVADVKFVSGDERFQPMSKKLATLKFKAPLPDDSPVKLVRRGVLVCAGSTLGCDFTLFTVDSVRSIR